MFASLQSMNELSSLPSVDSDNEALSFIQQVSSMSLKGWSHAHTHALYTKRVKGTSRTVSTWLTSQYDQITDHFM